ncbi:MAG TPA: hypothetical protein VFX30_10530 [bacterium]|nr:hypothetical protein [bacterium]
MNIEAKIDELIRKNPKFAFLRSAQFRSLTKEKQEFFLECCGDAQFWVELEKKPHSGDGFKFLAAAYGLQTAEAQAEEKKLEGKDREKFLRPHQDLFTMFNPYSGNGRETQKAPTPPEDQKPIKKK